MNASTFPVNADGVKRLGAVVALLLLVLAAPAPALAQTDETAGTGAAPSSASAEELERLVTTLEDEAERRKFLDNLNALIEAKRATGAAAEARPRGLANQALAEMSRRTSAVTRQLGQAANALTALPAAISEGLRTLASAEERRRWFIMVGELLAVLIGGLAAAWGLRRLLARPRARLAPRQPVTLPIRALLVAGRAVVDAVPVAAFAAVAWALVAGLQLQGTPALVAVTLINAVLLSHGVALVGRALLAPETPALRLPSLSDEAAGYLYGWLRRIALTGIYGFFGLKAASLLGLNPGAHAVLVKLLGLVIAGQLILVILQNRRRVGAWLGGGTQEQGQVASLRRRIAELWHLLAIVYVLAGYAVWGLGIEGGFPFLLRATVLTLAIGLLARAAEAALTRLLDRGIAMAPRLEADYPGVAARLNRYVPGTRRAVEIVVVAVAAVLILQAWQVDVLAVFGTAAGQKAVSVLVSLALVVVLATAAWEAMNALLERLYRRAMRTTTAPKRSARVQTLLPLLRNVLRIVVITFALLIGLSEIGVDIGPLLAGAGVLGLAIGFGAQTLAKDVITGVFLLAEDGLAIGDWVDVGGHSGEVENLTIRTITLRDLQGQVHVVPFSDVSSILNMSREFGYALIDVGVAYREDTDAVTALLEEVGRDLRADPEWGAKIIGDLEIFGVNDLADSAVVIRVRLKTLPVMQWGVRREFLRRTKKLFDARGVEIPFPHRTLYFGEGKDAEGQAALARTTPTTTSSTLPPEEAT